MARITAEQKEQNYKVYNEVIYDLFMNEGWDACSYGRIAKEVGVTPSSLQRYYPRRVDFGRALQGRVFPAIMGQLDFTSREAFISSWSTAVESGGVFTQVLTMLIQSALEKDTSPQTAQGITRLINVLAQHMTQEDAVATVETVLGLTIIKLIKQ